MLLLLQAANAGGVAVSGLEMSQNAMRLQWTSEEVDSKLKVLSPHLCCIWGMLAALAPVCLIQTSAFAYFSASLCFSVSVILVNTYGMHVISHVISQMLMVAL